MAATGRAGGQVFMYSLDREVRLVRRRLASYPPHQRNDVACQCAAYARGPSGVVRRLLADDVGAASDAAAQPGVLRMIQHTWAAELLKALELLLAA